MRFKRIISSTDMKVKIIHDFGLFFSNRKPAYEMCWGPGGSEMGLRASGLSAGPSVGFSFRPAATHQKKKENQHFSIKISTEEEY